MTFIWTSVQCLTGMEIRKFPNISFEHPRGSTFKKYRSQDLAPIWFTNPNFNHRVNLRVIANCSSFCGIFWPKCFMKVNFCQRLARFVSFITNCWFLCVVEKEPQKWPYYWMPKCLKYVMVSSKNRLPRLLITLRSLINVQSLITVQGVTLFYKKFKVSSGLGLFPFLRH